MFRGGHAASPPCLLRGASRISASIQDSESGSRISKGNLKCVLAGLSFCYNRNLWVTLGHSQELGLQLLRHDLPRVMTAFNSHGGH